MSKKKGLGRGLDALLASSQQREDTYSSDTGSERSELRELPVEWIEPGRYQPRRDMAPEALEELSASIRAQGVMQPIVVRRLDEQRYELIAGERRWRASQLAGLSSIPALIRQVSDEVAMAMALIENIQREDLSPIEEALALARLQDEFSLTHAEIAQAVGKSRSAVSNLLRLLSLEGEVRTLLEHGDLEMGHARALLTLDEACQRSLAQQIVSDGLSVRQAEELVRRLQAEQEQVPLAKNMINEESLVPEVQALASLEAALHQHFGLKVQIRPRTKGRGRLIIDYRDTSELEALLRFMPAE